MKKEMITSSVDRLGSRRSLSIFSGRIILSEAATKNSKENKIKNDFITFLSQDFFL
jgi:hypothetical protein